MVTFDVAAEAYGRFMGRYSEPLAVDFAGQCQPTPGQRALDVGCGPGALTAQLVERLGADAVCAIDPSPSFVAAIHARFPGVDVRRGVAEDLPFPEGAFDLTLAQLVVPFMTDPVAGLREMARVSRPGGLVSACAWDHAGGGSPLTTFWRAVQDTKPEAHSEAEVAGAREGHLIELCEAAGLNDIEPTSLSVTVRFASLADWWEPYTLGVGPAGAHVAQLDDDQRLALQSRCKQLLPQPPFEVTASAWCVRARP
jgi:SAM-dependent methyltransferase